MPSAVAPAGTRPEPRAGAPPRLAVLLTSALKRERAGFPSARPLLDLHRCDRAWATLVGVASPLLFATVLTAHTYLGHGPETVAGVSSPGILHDRGYPPVCAGRAPVHVAGAGRRRGCTSEPVRFALWLAHGGQRGGAARTPLRRRPLGRVDWCAGAGGERRFLVLQGLRQARQVLRPAAPGTGRFGAAASNDGDLGADVAPR